VVTAYDNQDYSQAESLAIEAYLENYEYIEAPLAEIDESLMLNTEVIMREELRQLIQDRVPVEQLQQHIDVINNNNKRFLLVNNIHPLKNSYELLPLVHSLQSLQKRLR